MSRDHPGPLQQIRTANFRERDPIARTRGPNGEVKLDQEKHLSGRFARFRDPEGHPVGLWEPADPASRDRQVGKPWQGIHLPSAHGWSLSVLFEFWY